MGRKIVKTDSISGGELTISIPPSTKLALEWKLFDSMKHRMI